MTDNKGLYHKYHVERTDGQPVDQFIFVLEISDYAAQEAILAYARMVFNSNPVLSFELTDVVRTYRNEHPPKSAIWPTDSDIQLLATLGTWGRRIDSINPDGQKKLEELVKYGYAQVVEKMAYMTRQGHNLVEEKGIKK